MSSESTKPSDKTTKRMAVDGEVSAPAPDCASKSGVAIIQEWLTDATLGVKWSEDVLPTLRATSTSADVPLPSAETVLRRLEQFQFVLQAERSRLAEEDGADRRWASLHTAACETIDALLNTQPWAVMGDVKVLREDADLVIVDKPCDVRLDIPRPSPSGRSVRGARRFDREQSVEDWWRLRSEYQNDEATPMRPCHQLDYATSGVLLLAKNRQTAHRVSSLFQSREIKKMYEALVFISSESARPTWTSATVTSTIGPVGPDSFMMMNFRSPPPRISVVDSVTQGAVQWTELCDPQAAAATGLCCGVGGGKKAETVVTVERMGRLNIPGPSFGRSVAVVPLYPLTGRRHQLRLHCQAMGLPIVGDATYTGDRHSFRMFLHARSISIPPTRGGPAIAVDAPSWFGLLVRDDASV
eukprot:Selendium_serpulae@DN6468_c0_g1_i7.p1